MPVIRAAVFRFPLVGKQQKNFAKEMQIWLPSFAVKKRFVGRY